MRKGMLKFCKIDNEITTAVKLSAISSQLSNRTIQLPQYQPHIMMPMTSSISSKGIRTVFSVLCSVEVFNLNYPNPIGLSSHPVEVRRSVL